VWLDGTSLLGAISIELACLFRRLVCLIEGSRSVRQREFGENKTRTLGANGLFLSPLNWELLTHDVGLTACTPNSNLRGIVRRLVAANARKLDKLSISHATSLGPQKNLHCTSLPKI
jgi:hypothetical protein